MKGFYVVLLLYLGVFSCSGYSLGARYALGSKISVGKQHRVCLGATSGQDEKGEKLEASLPTSEPLALISDVEVGLAARNVRLERREAAVAELLASSISSAMGFFLAEVICQVNTRRFSFLRFLRFGLVGGLSYGVFAKTARRALEKAVPGRSAPCRHRDAELV